MGGLGEADWNSFPLPRLAETSRGMAGQIVLIFSLVAVMGPLQVQSRLVALHSECPIVQRPLAFPCDQPVVRASVSYPRHLVLGDSSTVPAMYSGYINVTHEDYLFYLFSEAHASVHRDTPLIVWSGGGPGITAMEAAAIETGPLILYDVKDGSSMFTGKWTKNSFSWSRFAPVLYVDQPRYVGFSFGTGPPATTIVDIGKDMVHFLKGWFAAYPEHSRRPVIFASEGYGAHLVAAWVSAVMDHNAHDSEPLALGGVILGNAQIDVTAQDDASLLRWARQQKLVPKTIRPAATTPEVMSAMASTLGYEPNLYDYRLRNQECCGCTSYKYKAWADFLSMGSVKSALNVCGKAGSTSFSHCAAGCVVIPGFDVYGATVQTSRTLGIALGEGLPVMLYYGMQDSTVNYVGGFEAALGLQWTNSQEYQDADLKDFEIAGMVAGKLKSGGGLTWMQVEGAGHSVPLDNPSAAVFAVKHLMKLLMDKDPPSLMRYT